MYRIVVSSWSFGSARWYFLREMMKAVIFDFNGTLFFDSCFHIEAWSRIYREINNGADRELDPSNFCGQNNDTFIQTIAPNMTKEERQEVSVRKEAYYRDICRRNPEKLHLTAGAEALFSELEKRKIPFILATASITDNVEFYFQTFRLGQWFEREMCIYDDGTYANKGEMHLEAAKRLGTIFSECIVIEDSVGSICYAKENGAGKVIGIGSKPIHPELIRAGATHCICDFTEFNFEWLKN